MSGGAFRRSVVGGAAVLLLAAAQVAAQEKAATGAPANSAPPPDPAARVQRDFETIKSARDGLLHPKADVPRIDLPDWQGVPVPRTNPALKKVVPDPKSATWLIDAMKKESDSRDPRKPGGEERDRESVMKSVGGTPDIEQPSAASRDKVETRDEKERRTASTAVNPLTRYLGGWMTPQDYALLKPGLTESLGSRPEFKPGATTGNLSALEPGIALPSSDLAAALGPTPRAFAPPAARENPYLQALGAPPSALAALPQPKLSVAPPVSFPPMQSSLAPAPAPLPPSSRIPDFAKPANDDKYFKQLKRF